MQTYNINIYLIALLSLLFSIIIGRSLIKLKTPLSLIDFPNDRKTHTNPTPLIGGITVLFSSLIIIIIFNLFQYDSIEFYLIFAIYFFLIGLIDDIFKLNFQKKLILQILGIVLFLYSLQLNIEQLTFSTITLESKYINYFIIGFWMLFIINAFNFFDGINFLAGSVCIVFFISYVIFYLINNELLPITIMVILIFTILGFLIYNREPVKMFLGDAGSMFLGFTIVGLPLIFSNPSGKSLDLTFPIIVSFILISDTLFVLFTRIKNKNNPFYADKTHLHHQLLNLNFRNRYVVLIILEGSILHSLLAFKSVDLNLTWIILSMILLNIIFIILPRFLPLLFKKYKLWGLKIIYDNMINYLKEK